MQVCVAGQRVAPNAVSGVRYTYRARQGIALQCPERGINGETLEVRAVEVTSSNIGDAPVLPELLNQIPADQVIGSVTAPSHACKHALPGNGWSV